MEYTIDQILEWKKCGCGRKHCLVFDGGIGEYGSSISEYELKSVIEELKEEKYLKKTSKNKAIRHIENLLGISKQV